VVGLLREAHLAQTANEETQGAGGEGARSGLREVFDEGFERGGLAGAGEDRGDGIVGVATVAVAMVVLLGGPLEEGEGEFPSGEAREDGLHKGRRENGSEAVEFQRGGAGLSGEDGDEVVGHRRIIIRIVIGCCRIREFGEDRGKRTEFHFVGYQSHQHTFAPTTPQRLPTFIRSFLLSTISTNIQTYR